MDLSKELSKQLSKLPVGYEERTVVQIHLPVVLSGALKHSVNTEKILKHYERICAYTYTRSIIGGVSRGFLKRIRDSLIRLKKFFVPLEALIGTLATIALIYNAFRSPTQKGQESRKVAMHVAPKADNKAKMYKSKKSVMLAEADIELTELVVDPTLKVQYIAYVAVDKIGATPKDIIISTAAKAKDTLGQIMYKTTLNPNVQLIAVGFNYVCYILSLPEYEELGDLLRDHNLVIVNFTDETVETRLIVPPNKVVSYTTPLKDVLTKFDTETMDISELVASLKGTKREQ